MDRQSGKATKKTLYITNNTIFFKIGTDSWSPGKYFITGQGTVYACFNRYNGNNAAGVTNYTTYPGNRCK